MPKTTKEIYEKAFVKDHLFWVRETDTKEQICSMDNNPKNEQLWFSQSEVEQLRKELKEKIISKAFYIPKDCLEDTFMIIDSVFDKYKRED